MKTVKLVFIYIVDLKSNLMLEILIAIELLAVAYAIYSSQN